MQLITSLLDRVLALDAGLRDGSLIREVVVRYEDEIMNLQKEQLFDGKAASGDDIRPYYSEDLKPGGYFYSVESAGRYSAWKQDISPGNNRNPDAPNLWINGKFHSELGVRFDPETMTIAGTTPYAAGIVAKYGLSTFGLTDENWARIWREYGGYGQLLEQTKAVLYG